MKKKQNPELHAVSRIIFALLTVR